MVTVPSCESEDVLCARDADERQAKKGARHVAPPWLVRKAIERSRTIDD